jgi:hypothetical protein
VDCSSSYVHANVDGSDDNDYDTLMSNEYLERLGCDVCKIAVDLTDVN